MIFRPRVAKMAYADRISLPAWAEEKARALGWDYHVLRGNWLTFAKEESAKGNPPKNAGAAFVAYAKKQDKLR